MPGYISKGVFIEVSEDSFQWELPGIFRVDGTEKTKLAVRGEAYRVG